MIKFLASSKQPDIDKVGRLMLKVLDINHDFLLSPIEDTKGKKDAEWKSQLFSFTYRFFHFFAATKVHNPILRTGLPGLTQMSQARLTTICTLSLS